MFARKWSRRAIGAAVLVIVLTISGSVMLLRSRGTAEIVPVPFSDLLRDVDRGAVAELVVTGDTLDFARKDGRHLRTIAPANYAAANAAFIPSLASRGIRIEVRNAAEPAAYS